MKRTHYIYFATVCTNTQLKIDNCDHDEVYHGVCEECGEEDVCDHEYDYDEGGYCVHCQHEPW